MAALLSLREKVQNQETFVVVVVVVVVVSSFKKSNFNLRIGFSRKIHLNKLLICYRYSLVFCQENITKTKQTNKDKKQNKNKKQNKKKQKKKKRKKKKEKKRKQNKKWHHKS